MTLDIHSAFSDSASTDRLDSRKSLKEALASVQADSTLHRFAELQHGDLRHKFEQIQRDSLQYQFKQIQCDSLAWHLKQLKAPNLNLAEVMSKASPLTVSHPPERPIFAESRSTSEEQYVSYQRREKKLARAIEEGIERLITGVERIGQGRKPEQVESQGSNTSRYSRLTEDDFIRRQDLIELDSVFENAVRESSGELGSVASCVRLVRAGLVTMPNGFPADGRGYWVRKEALAWKDRTYPNNKVVTIKKRAARH